MYFSLTGIPGFQQETNFRGKDNRLLFFNNRLLFLLFFVLFRFENFRGEDNNVSVEGKSRLGWGALSRKTDSGIRRSLKNNKKCKTLAWFNIFETFSDFP